MTVVSIDEALLAAGRHHQAGRFAEAEAIYRQVLAQEPNHHRALHMAGVLAGQTGRLDAAIELIQKATALFPGDAIYHNNLGKFLSDARRWNDAIAALQKAVVVRPAYASAHYNLGHAFQQKGDLARAIASYDEALRHKPDYPAACNNRGNAFKDLGDEDAALASYRRALVISPDYAEAHYNLGQLLMKRGAFAEAQSHLTQSIRLKPTADAYICLSVALNATGNADEAMANCLEALRLKPDLADAHSNLGLHLYNRGQLDEAVASCREALRLKPDFAEACCNLGMALKDRGELTESLASFREALRHKPDFHVAHGNLAYVQQFHPDYDAPAMREELRRFDDAYCRPLRVNIPPHENDRAPGRRLRIGYVSPDFRDHCQALFTVPLLSSHDRKNFEIFAYSDVQLPVAMTRQLQGYCDHWREIAGLPDATVARRIRDGKIDILVDLTMHMANNRLLVFARKPAPVQVTWLAYPGSTGVATMDYRLTDPTLDPPDEGMDARYSETSIRLPDTFWCYDALIDRPEVNALPAEKNGYLMFGCLNNFCKVNDGILALWARILNAVRNSRLMLLACEGSHRARTTQFLGRHGIAPDRIQFVAARPRLDFLRLFHEIDIGLDTLPYNGHTTSLDSFWMGVPVVTLVGTTVVGRAGLSQLTNLRLPELITYAADDYVRTVVELAGDLPRLAALRSSLRARMAASPLMDAPRFARGIEAAYRAMWQKWCAAKP